MAKLKYCIVKGAKSKDPCTVYVTLANETKLNPTVVDHKHFPEVKKILETHGFDHIMVMTFRSKDSAVLKLKALNADLKKAGYERDQDLESSVKEQMEVMKELRKKTVMMIPYDLTGSTQDNTGFPIFSNPHGISWANLMHGGPQFAQNIVKKTDMSNVVDIGGKLDLYVYLFLRVNPTLDKSVEFEFEFDFFSRDNDGTRRFIKMIQCTFIRQPNDTENIMYLESEKTLRDILKEVDFLYSIRLFDPYDVLNGRKSPPMIYNAIELKDFLELDSRMSLQIDIDNNYDQVLSLSEKIKKEKKKHDKNMQIPVSLIKKVSESIVKRMEQRMHHYSDKEDYELAASYRKNKIYIENKVQLLDSLEAKGVERLSNDEYEASFSMKDLDF